MLEKCYACEVTNLLGPGIIQNYIFYWCPACKLILFFNINISFTICSLTSEVIEVICFFFLILSSGSDTPCSKMLSASSPGKISSWGSLLLH